MAYKAYTTQQRMLLNKQLKEWNDTITSETASLYQLRCQHTIERDQLSFEKNTDIRQHSALTNRQSRETDELKQRNNEKRTAIRDSHVKEQAAFQPKIAESGTR